MPPVPKLVLLFRVMMVASNPDSLCRRIYSPIDGSFPDGISIKEGASSEVVVVLEEVRTTSVEMPTKVKSKKKTILEIPIYVGEIT